MAEQKLNFKCKECGGAFSVFLEQMAEHNEKVTCPYCGKTREYGRSDIDNTATDAACV